MPKRSTYRVKMPVEHIPLLFKEGKRYWCDLETGTLGSCRTGQPLYTFHNRRFGRHLFVRLFDAPMETGIAVSRVVWMVGNDRPLPEGGVGWEVHHRDENAINNAFDNLVLVWNNDHKKLHRNEPEEIPF